MISRDLRDSLIEVYRQMRSSPREAEKLLWHLLKDKKLSRFKFRRQHIIHTFIVDFYCPIGKLVVEVDGEIHQKNREYDQERDARLMDQGYRVLRFTNQQVLKEPFDVLSTIRKSLSL